MSFKQDKENFIQNLVDTARAKKQEINTAKVESTHKNYQGTEDDCPFLQTKKNKEEQNKQELQPLQDIDLNNMSLNTADSSNSLIPKGHPKTSYNEQDKEKCPYFKMQNKSALNVQPTIQVKEDQENNDQYVLSSSSEDEDGVPKRPKGGCPFLPSERKKNPGLCHAMERFSSYYLSRYACYLEQDSLMSLKRDFGKIINSKPRKDRRIFENYPIYLKHTLFHEDEVIQKIRKKEIVERFLAYDKYRERGNRLFNKKKYQDALNLYERAFSCYRWLELKDETDEEDKKAKKKKNENNHIQINKSNNVDIFEEQKTSTITQRNLNNNDDEKIKKTEEKKVKKQNIIKKKKKEFKEDMDDKLDGQHNQNQQDSDLEFDNDKEILEYKTNDGESKNKINELIQSRQLEILEQERQRQLMLSKLRKDKQQEDGQNSEDSRNLSDFNNEDEQENSIRNKSDNDDEDEESNIDEKERERINETQYAEDDAKSLSVEGFDDGSDRNFSSSEEEIDIEKIKDENKNPDETVIIMDEEEKKKMIAQELFLRQNQKEDKEFRKKYRLYLTNFNDDNVILHDGEDLTDSNDIDLRLSMLVGSCLSLGTCYMMLGHFKEAMIAFRDARNLHKKGSSPLFRMVQCRLYNKASTYTELLEAKEWLEQSIEFKKEEKVFNSGPASLVVMNIMNHESFYEEVRLKLEDKLEAQKQVELERLTEMFERVVELNEIEQEMIERGVTPAEYESNVIEVQEKEIEEELSKIIEGKYYTLLESQMFAQNFQKMNKTKEELQQYYETYSVMEYYKNLDFKNYETNPLMKQLAEEYKVDMNRPKNQLRFSKLIVENMKDTFNSVEHNFALYKWALDEYMEKKKKIMEKRKQNETPQPKSTKDKLSTLLNTLFGKQSLVQFIIVFIVFYIIILFLRSNINIPIPGINLTKK